MNEHRATAWLLAVLIAMMGVGCVGQQPYDDLQEAYRKQGEQIVELKALVESKDAEIAALHGQISDQNDLKARLSALQTERATLAAQLARLEKQMRGMTPGAVLPAELNRALMELAKANPDLMTYDPRLGMVRFRSDLAFALGSDRVSAEAKAAITRLANILRTPAASQYEIQIVGHTDNIPIRKPDPRATPDQLAPFRAPCHRGEGRADRNRRRAQPDHDRGVRGVSTRRTEPRRKRKPCQPTCRNLSQTHDLSHRPGNHRDTLQGNRRRGAHA